MWKSSLNFLKFFSDIDTLDVVYIEVFPNFKVFFLSQALQMLNTWKRQEREKALTSIFVQALKDSGMTDALQLFWYKEQEQDIMWHCFSQ